MAEQHAAVDIAASPERVWDVLTDVPTWHEWMPEVRGATTTTPSGGVGAIYELSRGMGFSTSVRVTEHDAPSRFGVQQRESGITTTATYLLSPIGAGTRVEATLASDGAVAGVMSAIFGGSVSAQLGAELEALARRCESQA